MIKHIIIGLRFDFLSPFCNVFNMQKQVQFFIVLKRLFDKCLGQLYYAINTFNICDRKFNLMEVLFFLQQKTLAALGGQS